LQRRLRDGPVTDLEYSAASQLRHPGQFFHSAVLSARASLPLARRIFLRDIRARYRQSVLGFLWILLPALAQTAIWLFLNASNIVNGGETDIPYPVFVLVGTLLWQSFSEALFTPSNQITNAAQMLARVNFPPESLLLAGLTDAAVNTAVRLVVTVPILLLYDVGIGWSFLLAPIGILALLGLGFSIGLVIAPFSLLYHDLSRLLMLVTGFWLLVTPVAYTIPSSGPGRLIAVLNPVTPLLETTRNWITGGALTPPDLFAPVAFGAVALLFLGWVLFRLSMPHLVDRFGS
jgi:lipopolysaccharide transport system permease protein